MNGNEEKLLKKVLLYAGAFNPPHNVHVETLVAATRQDLFEEVWILPSGNRDDKVITTSYEDRRTLGSLFVQCLQQKLSIPVKLLTAELDDTQKRLTQDVINELDSLPGIELVHLIGSDGYGKLKAAGRIRNDIKYLVRNRPGYATVVSQDENVSVIDGLSNELSSTEIRDMIKSHDSEYANFLPETITAYIEEHKLYS